MVTQKTIENLSHLSVLKLFSNNIGQFVFWKDRNSVYLGCNANFAEYANMTEEQIIGKTDYDLPWSKDEADHFRMVDKEVMDWGKPELNFEESQTLASGETVWIRTSKVPIFNNLGQVVGVLGWYSDVTKLKKMEIQLNESNKELFEYSQRLENLNKELEIANQDLENFTYAASHDLKTPLRSIVSNLQLIERKYGDSFNEDALDIFKSVVNGGKRMSRLIDDILTYARTGKANNKPSEIDLQKLVCYKLESLQKVIRDKNCNITINLPDKPIDCYPALIGLVFYNLINNGIKYNESTPPTIHLDYREAPDEWLFSITDNGIGIEEKNRKLIFDAFKRLNTYNQYEGSGIGLSICQRIINIHKGRIWVEPNIGGGSVFHFSISKYLT